MRFGCFAILAIFLLVFSGAAVSAQCITGDFHDIDINNSPYTDNHVNLTYDDYLLIHQNNPNFDYDAYCRLTNQTLTHDDYLLIHKDNPNFDYDAYCRLTNQTNPDLDL